MGSSHNMSSVKIGFNITFFKACILKAPNIFTFIQICLVYFKNEYRGQIARICQFFGTYLIFVLLQVNPLEYS